MTEPAFYTVTGRDFFPGAVALLNSLRLVGHSGPLHVLDAGMDDHQRELLAPHATLVPAPAQAPPSLLKLVAPLAHPAAAMVLLDADVIVTRRLDELVAAALDGMLVAFENDRRRFFEEWSGLLGLGPLREAPYLSTSAVFLGADLAAELLPLAHERQAAVDPEHTWLGRGGEEHPLYYLDQDVLNAVVAARLPAARVLAVDRRLAATPPFDRLRLRDARTLRCEYRDGTLPFMLHHWAAKPWLVPVRSNVYSRLLTRLVLAPDVALRLAPDELPPRLRGGAAAWARRTSADAVLTVRGIARRLRRRPPPIRAWPPSGSAADG